MEVELTRFTNAQTARQHSQLPVTVYLLIDADKYRRAMLNRVLAGPVQSANVDAPGTEEKLAALERTGAVLACEAPVLAEDSVTLQTLRMWAGEVKRSKTWQFLTYMFNEPSQVLEEVSRETRESLWNCNGPLQVYHARLQQPRTKQPEEEKQLSDSQPKEENDAQEGSGVVVLIGFLETVADKNRKMQPNILRNLRISRTACQPSTDRDVIALALRAIELREKECMLQLHEQWSSLTANK